MTNLKPCIFERKILAKVWGGRSLEKALGIELPEGELIGESWELYDRLDGSSRVCGSHLTLRDLMAEDPAALLGRGVLPTREGYFPLLIKYIDAADKLSVQVHPDDAAARSENDGGKSEAWVVLQAGKDARIIWGFTPEASREHFAQVAHTSEVEGLLHAIQPSAGDAIYVPAGTVHALGPDVVVCEIQQNSDLTYRLYDWGRPRQTHVEKALAATRVEPADPAAARTERISDAAEWLFRTEHFSTRRMRLVEPSTLGTEGSFKILSVLSGRGTLGWRSGGEDPPLPLGMGDTVLVPASVNAVFLSPVGMLQLLVTGPGIGVG